MNGDEFLDKMELVHPAYVEAAKNQTQKKKAPWKKWIAMAACLCVVIAGAATWDYLTSGTKNTGFDNAKSESLLEDGALPGESNGSIGEEQYNTSLPEDGIYIPKTKVYLAANDIVEIDMVAFFIYQGNVYTQYDRVSNRDDLAGEYIGTATGLIDEWTQEDGYVELAGSIEGDFYSVNGYDPSFMLCMKEGNGDISTYICDNGITLRYGSDLYEDRLHLSDNYEQILCETRGSWNYGKQEIVTMDSSEDVLSGFIEELNNAEFMLWETVPEKEGHTNSSIYETEQYHLYFKMEDGTTIHLRLYEHGYVRYQGVLGACVQIPEETYQNLITYFREVNPYEET